ncbi:MAG: DUF2723 domain-containing protein [Myxococcota bacterium]|nr:DUF2723 domain-containing protein [Myxococcota bacterium]
MRSRSEHSPSIHPALPPCFGLCATYFYWLTSAPGLQWFDAGELALVGAQGGLGHPPGQPLVTLIHLLLAEGARSLSLDPLAGIALLSPLSMGWALSELMRVNILLSRRIELGLTGHQLLFSTSLLAISYPLWDQARRVEVYALALALALATLRSSESQRPRLAGFFLGGCAACNPLFALSIALSLTLRRGRERGFQEIGSTALYSLMMLMICYLYLFLPLGAKDGRMVWGAWSQAGTLWRYLSGADYAGTGHSAWSALPTHALEWLEWADHHGLTPLLAGSALGLCTRPLRSLFFTLIIPCGLLAIFPWSYDRYWPEVPDFTAYLLLPLCLSSFGIAALLASLERRAPSLRISASVLLFALIISRGIQQAPLYRSARLTPSAPEQLARSWLDSLPPRTLLLLSSDHLIFSIAFEQRVRGYRPDVTAIGLGLSASSWYWTQLRALDPTLPPPPRARSSLERLHRLTLRISDRPVVAESPTLAAALQLPSCPAPWGVSLSCLSPLRPQGAEAEVQALRTLQRWSEGPLRADPISARVFAHLSQEQAFAWWLIGDQERSIAWLQAEVGHRHTGNLQLRETMLPVTADRWRSPESLIANHTHGATLLQALRLTKSSESLPEATSGSPSPQREEERTEREERRPLREKK